MNKHSPIARFLVFLSAIVFVSILTAAILTPYLLYDHNIPSERQSDTTKLATFVFGFPFAAPVAALLRNLWLAAQKKFPWFP